ncbi:superinfection immunity protein [Candidatus Poriferisodalis sp.]|uniref:superinfection immunity protein n=1 Tax=Candidatus Poriferisodalis sp. TaxID=3101277 RepID=UPI003AF67A65
MYCLPSVVALLRRQPRTGRIIALNVLGGWTVVGWLLALSWSCADPNERRQQRGSWSSPSSSPLVAPRPRRTAPATAIVSETEDRIRERPQTSRKTQPDHHDTPESD